MIDTSISYLERAARAPEARDFSSRTDERPREACIKCNGTGTWRSFSGRSIGQCFACKGSGRGKLLDATSVRNRERAAQKRQEAATSAATEAHHWLQSNPDRAAWLNAKAPTFGFAASLATALIKYGYLTENQIAALDRCRAKDADRAGARQQELAARSVALPPMTSLVEMFERAMANGLKRICVRIGAIRLSPAKATGRNPGAIYVKDDGEYAGKIVDGSFIPTREAAADLGARLTEIAADPLTAAKVHGQRTGTCSCCGAELTNALSIELGIGPICREKFFG